MNHASTLADIRVLIVDDEPTTLDVLCASLEADGCTVLVATTGQGAVRAARRSRPDLILLDVGLPGMNGIRTCESLMMHPVTATMPVVFLSASEEPGVAEQCREAGAIDFIPKRRPWPEILQRVRAHLMSLRAVQPIKQPGELSP
jgi:CheY-like chemotaxis protein